RHELLVERERLLGLARVGQLARSALCQIGAQTGEPDVTGFEERAGHLWKYVSSQLIGAGRSHQLYGPHDKLRGPLVELARIEPGLDRADQFLELIDIGRGRGTLEFVEATRQ